MFMRMVDMELDDEDQFDAPSIAGGDKPKYPWGLRISLSEKEMDKLGIDASCAFVGGICHLHALAKVTSVSSNETQDADGDSSEHSRVELQITAMAIESEDDETGDMGAYGT